jgi:hypothetical protein
MIMRKRKRKKFLEHSKIETVKDPIGITWHDN